MTCAFSGVQVVDRVAREYSVNPRLLLAVLEYQSGWVTRSTTPDARREYPMGKADAYRKGLYKQLAWAADNLNRGYYLWKVNGISGWPLADGGIVVASPRSTPAPRAFNISLAYYTIGPIGKKRSAKKVCTRPYASLFGNPFGYSFEPSCRQT